MQMAAASEGCRQPLWRAGGVLASGIQESDLAQQSPAVSRSPTSWPRPETSATRMCCSTCCREVLAGPVLCSCAAACGRCGWRPAHRLIASAALRQKHTRMLVVPSERL